MIESKNFDSSMETCIFWFTREGVKIKYFFCLVPLEV